MPKEENKNNLNNAKKAEIALNKYKPVDGPKPWQLKWGLRWIENRALLRRILSVVLILTSVFSWGYSAYGFGYYAYKGIQDDEKIGRDLLTIPKISNNFIKSNAAQELTLGPVNILPSIKNTYDLAVEVQNLNKDWYADFDYFFTISNNKTEAQHEFILPGEKKYLVEFLYDNAKPTNTILNITNLRWHRINPFDIEGTVEEYLKSNSNVSVSDIKLEPGKSSAGNSSMNTMIFKAKNNTPYNFWSVDFYFALQSGSRLLGVNKYKIEKLFSGEEREIGFSWLGGLGGSKVLVIPSVNIFDDNNYMPFDLGPGQLK